MNLILTPFVWLQEGVAFVLVMFHKLFSPVFGSENGITWVLSIIGLVVVIRICLIPLFVKQIKAQRNMQLIQPKMKEIQKKYAGDREKQSQEMMKLYRETGTNPLASCLPIILQAPIFFALFRVLQGHIAHDPPIPIGILTQPLADSAHNATIFGVPIYGTFAHAAATPNPMNTKILAVVLIIAMSATTFITQRQLVLKNTAADNPIAKQQKILVYVFPFIFALGGFNFPIGVLIYWTTTNVWSMGQQFYVIRNNPQPDTPAHAAYLERQKAKAAAKLASDPEAVARAVAEAADNEGETNKGTTVQNRQQPKRQSRSKRQPQKKANPPGSNKH